MVNFINDWNNDKEVFEIEEIVNCVGFGYKEFVRKFYFCCGCCEIIEEVIFFF